MSDDGLEGFTESLKILDTTFDLATLVSPLKCVKLLLIKVLLAHTLLVRYSPPIINSCYSYFSYSTPLGTYKA